MKTKNDATDALDGSPGLSVGGKHRWPCSAALNVACEEGMKTDSQLCVAWTNNCRGRVNDALYVMHAYRAGSRTLCGCEVQEVGEPVGELRTVSCRRCLTILGATNGK